MGCVPLFSHDNIRRRFNFVFLTPIPMLARSQQSGLVRDDYDWDFWIGVDLLYVDRLWFVFWLLLERHLPSGMASMARGVLASFQRDRSSEAHGSDEQSTAKTRFAISYFAPPFA